jgi:hypothetical protein
LRKLAGARHERGNECGRSTTYLRHERRWHAG